MNIKQFKGDNGYFCHLPPDHPTHQGWATNGRWAVSPKLVESVLKGHIRKLIPTPGVIRAGQMVDPPDYPDLAAIIPTFVGGGRRHLQADKDDCRVLADEKTGELEIVSIPMRCADTQALICSISPEVYPFVHACHRIEQDDPQGPILLYHFDKLAGVIIPLTGEEVARGDRG